MKKSFLAAALLVASTCLFAQDAKLTPYSERTTKHPSFMYRTGYRGDIELSGSFDKQFLITTTHGMTFGNGLFAGAGVGFGADLAAPQKTQYVAPFYAAVKYDFLNYLCTPFVALKAGGVVDLGQQLGLRVMLNPTIGVDIDRVSLYVGYDWQYGVVHSAARMSHVKLGVSVAF